MLWAFLAAQAGAGVSLSPAEARRIGRQIWQNECGGTVSGLTSWNTGEDFASLGIGHFIWYPEGKRGPFEESFPRFIAFAGHHGVKLPDSLTGAATKPCPWSSRAQFQRSQQSAEMKQLRQFLADTIDLQTQFMIQRLENALPKMLEETTASNRAVVQRQFERLTKSGRGCYALIDYVNFKGEGVLHTERYAGQGWGLLQVLEEMREKGSDAPKEFARSAAAVLTRRVHNSPPERNEARWLSGWIRRVNSYSRG
jgi:hypothetical protein